MTERQRRVSLPLPPGTMIVFDHIVGEVKTGDYAGMWEETVRAAVIWRKRAEDLEEAVNEYLLWEPGRRGHAAAHRRLVAVFRGEEVDDD